MPQGGDILEIFEIKHLHVNQYLNLVPHFLRMFSIVNLTRLMLLFCLMWKNKILKSYFQDKKRIHVHVSQKNVRNDMMMLI
jgi:hypothetical protein